MCSSDDCLPLLQASPAGGLGCTRVVLMLRSLLKRGAAALAPFALFAFLLNFVWEMLQTPLFAWMPQLPHWPMTLICLRATLGDVGIAIVAFVAGAAADKRLRWFEAPSKHASAAYIAAGILLTTVFELHAIGTGRWAYSKLMPTLPWIGIGLAPFLQWIILPPIVLYLTRRHHTGSSA